ncbi:MAG: HPF/RaiA family ribosome-associated protein [Pseudomonadota bacterium]
MQTQAEIAYHHMDPQPHVAARVDERIERLETHFGRLVSCRVTVDAPHQRHKTGNAYIVRLEARTPTGVFVVDHQPGDRNAHTDVLVALRDAFDALERQLSKWKETHSGRPATHTEPFQGRIAELRPERDFGQIAMTDGRLVYFHKNAVGEGGFADLKVGDPVRLAIEWRDNEEGPHATYVAPISAQAFTDKPH